MKEKKDILSEIEKFDRPAKRYFNRSMKTWMDNDWSRKTAFREAYQETLQYLKERGKWNKWNKIRRNKDEKRSD